MTWIIWVIIALVAVYILNLILVLILENRDPYKTIAWILILVFLPVIGTIAYFFLGESIKRTYYSWRFKRKKYSKIAQKIVEVQKDHLRNEQLPEELKGKRHTMYLALHSTEFPLSKDNTVKILNNGNEFFPELFEEIEKAKNHIHLEYYIFEFDELGKKLIDLLIKKSKDGVKVRVLIDGLGSYKFPSNAERLMKKNNIEFAKFTPLYYGIFDAKVNHNNHRKIAIIDGKIAFIGGINIGQEYLDGGVHKFWRDVQLKIQGSAVYSLQSIFVRDWGFAAKKDIYSYSLYPKQDKIGNVYLHVAPSGPDMKWANLKLIIFSMITNTEKRLYIETPYFIPDDSLLMALKSTALKGVDVRIMITEKSDTKVVDAAARTFFKELMDSGVRIFLYKKGFLHAKILISDNISSIGSTNLDVRSLNLNFEANAFIFDTKTTEDLVEIFNSDLNDCIEVTKKDLYMQSKWSRFKQSLARLLSPLL